MLTPGSASLRDKFDRFPVETRQTIEKAITNQMVPISRKTIKETFDYLLSKRRDIQEGLVPIKEILNSNDIENFAGDEIPEKGFSEEQLAEAVRVIEKNTTHFGNAGFFSYFPACQNTEQILMNILLWSAHDGIDISKFPYLSPIERKITEDLRVLLRIPDDFSWHKGGFASMNITMGYCSVQSTFLAKFKKLEELGITFPNFDDEEMSSFRLDASKTFHKAVSKLVGYYPEYAHGHCVKSLTLNGIRHTRKIPVVFNSKTKNFETDLDYLQRVLERDSESGLYPCIIFSALGATSCCGVDDIPATSKLAKKHGALLAVDAAYSGVFLPLPKYEQFRKVIKYADFYFVNFMKFGYGGQETALWFHKDRALHGRAHLLNPEEPEETENLGNYRLGESSRFTAIKLAFHTASMGQQGFMRLIQRGEDAFEDFTKRFKTNEDFKNRFELFPQSQFALLCFRGLFKELDQNKFNELEPASREAFLKRYNSALLEKINSSPMFHMVGSENAGFYYLRLALKWPLSPTKMDETFDHILKSYYQVVDTYKQPAKTI